MPNVFITAQQISALATELLVRSIVLPRTVARVAGTEFAGRNGDTISVSIRLPRTAKTQAVRGAAITFDLIDEVSVDVTVAHLYDAVLVTDEELTLDIADFGAQVLEPMVRAVAVGAEAQVAAAMNGLTADLVSVTADNVEDMVLQAREDLGKNDVPTGRRTLAVSPAFATLLLGLENLSDVSAAGSPSALRDAVIGSYRGFMVVESNGLTDGTAVAYHESAFVWANRAPAIPGGASSAAVSNREGVALRTVQDFDVSHLSDAIAVSTFAGAAVVLEDGDGGTDRQRAVKLTMAAA